MLSLKWLRLRQKKGVQLLKQCFNNKMNPPVDAE